MFGSTKIVDGKTDGTDGRTENRTHIPHLAKAGATKREKKENDCRSRESVSSICPTSPLLSLA